MSATYDKSFNAKRGALRSGLQPHEIEVFKTEDGRFGWRKIMVEPTVTVAPVETQPIDDTFEPPAFLRRAEKAEAEVEPAPETSISIADLIANSHPIAAANAASWPTPPKGKRAAILDRAKLGDLPSPPDFSKPTHARFRGKLAKLVALVEAGDVDALKAMPINPVSTSPKALARYRDLAILALEARRHAA